MTKPALVLLAGPNGVGKTTFAHANLVEFVGSNAFLNADDIAHAMSPDDVTAVAIDAGRRLIEKRRARLAAGQSFCLETILATRTLLRFVKQAGSAGFRTRLIFRFTPFPQLNELRVRQRVMAGGHNVDTATIHRRHRLGLIHLADYRDTCDEAVLYDARTLIPRETLVKDEAGNRIMDRFGWMSLSGRLQVLGARVPSGFWPLKAILLES